MALEVLFNQQKHWKSLTLLSHLRLYWIGWNVFYLAYLAVHNC